MLTLGEIKGVGDATLKKLATLNITSVFELLSFFPTKYVDLSNPLSVDADSLGYGVFIGKVIKIYPVTRYGKRSFSVLFKDELGGKTFKVTYYSMPYMVNNFELDKSYRLFGKLSYLDGAFYIINPKIERADKVSKLQGIYTVYALRGLMGQNVFKNIVYSTVDELKKAVYAGRFASVNEDIFRLFCSVHRPETVLEGEEAKASLAAIDMAIVYEIYQKQRQSIKNSRKVFYKNSNFRILDYINALPFNPTDSQMQAFESIFSDLHSDECMARIISGDVGSGKTAVAFFAMILAGVCNHQSVLMVPTEILANQHFAAFSKIAAKFSLKSALLTSSLSAKEKNAIYSDIKSGDISCVIGTQALIADAVEYEDLSLAVIDEQHKFGVAERRKIESKGAVDVLSMTATPIPRSMALTFYSDIAISHIEKRKEAKTNVETVILPSLDEGVRRIISACREGKQAFIVCPSIVDDEGNNLMSIEEFVKTYKGDFVGFPVSVLHGKMSKDEKSVAMQSFANGDIRILIATTVIEVGVDTKATEILILNADRFGLASLHQLRGRIGRGGEASHCYLYSGNLNEKSLARLALFKENNDGQYLAEIDFALRGAGDFIGTRQSGVSFTPIFDLRYNADTLKRAKVYAEQKLTAFSPNDLMTLTRRSKDKVAKFLDEINRVTLNS